MVLCIYNLIIIVSGFFGIYQESTGILTSVTDISFKEIIMLRAISMADKLAGSFRGTVDREGRS